MNINRLKTVSETFTNFVGPVCSLIGLGITLLQINKPEPVQVLENMVVGSDVSTNPLFKWYMIGIGLVFIIVGIWAFFTLRRRKRK